MFVVANILTSEDYLGQAGIDIYAAFICKFLERQKFLVDYRE